MTGSSITPLVFGSADAALFGVLTLPAPERTVDRGVVICSPLGYENVVYYRQLAVLARLLGDAGRPTLRFDWPGCGDSAGDDNDLDQVESYIDSVGAAVLALRERTGVEKVDLVGLRIGATLALASCSRGATLPMVPGSRRSRTSRSGPRTRPAGRTCARCTRSSN